MTYRTAILWIIIGGALLSLLGIGVRLMDTATSKQIIFFRSVASASFLLLVLFARDRAMVLQSITSIGSRGWLAASFLAVASLFMILSLEFTSVANAVFIVSLAPLCSAILGWLILKERVLPRTWWAILIGVLGISIIFADGLSTGGLLGMFFAFLMMFLYSSSLIAIRSQSGADMLALCAMSAVLLAIGIAPFVESFSISEHDLALCIALGVVQIGLGMVLITTGAQYVPAAQVSLLALLEVVLSPLWVWIGVGEVPTIYSLIGGAIVLTGVALQALATSPKPPLGHQPTHKPSSLNEA